MTLEEIRAKVREIKALQDNNQAAHVKEDKLYHAFIKEIAQQDEEEARGYVFCADLAEKAREILKTDDIDFVRWYA